MKHCQNHNTENFIILEILYVLYSRQHYVKSDNYLRGVHIMEKQLRLFMALIMVLALVPWGAMGVVPVSIPGTNASIEEAILYAVSQDDDLIITIGQDGYRPNLTLTQGNVTFINRNVTINYDFATLDIIMNGSLLFNGTDTWLTINKPTIINASKTSYDVSYYNNASILQFYGNNATLSASSLTLSGQNFLTAVNHSKYATLSNITASTTISNARRGMEIFGSNSRFENVVFTGITETALNITGSTNDILNPVISDASAAKFGINLTGNTNNITATLNTLTGSTDGIFYIGPGATGNTITLGLDNYGSASVYNGTQISSRQIAYFFNETQSLSGKNMNMTVNFTGFPLYGAVDFSVNATNMTGIANNWWSNTSSTLMDQKGQGTIWNLTYQTIFAATNTSPAMVLPVNASLRGGNTLNGNTIITGMSPIVIINYNPFWSLPGGPGEYSWNQTYTKNWTELDDFSAVNGLIFAVNNANGNLLANLTFNEAIDLTDQATGYGLAELGTALSMNKTTIGLDVSGALSKLNKKAILTIYPEFAFTADAASIIRVADDGTEKILFTGGEKTVNFSTYAEGAVTIGTDNISFTTKGFSNYIFGNSNSKPSTAPTPAPSDGRSGDSAISSSGPVTAGTGTTLTYIGVPISAITLESDAELPSAIILVERVRLLPTGITPPSQEVYQYVEITPISGTAEHIKEGATISFSVPVGYLSAMGMTTNDVALLRNVNGVWTQLPTRLVKVERGVAYYEATTPGFSTFAIALQKDGASEVAPVATPKPETEVKVVVEEEEVVTHVPATPVPVADVTPAPSAPAAPGDAPAPFPMTYVIIGIVIILLIIGGAYYFTKKEDKK
ncbi:PGF-pre-PGF domain-containing protein [Methanocalculus sp. MC3]